MCLESLGSVGTHCALMELMSQPEVRNLVQTPTNAEPEGPSPVIRFRYAMAAAQVLPTLISHSSLPWRAAVYLACLDAVISPWLSWAGVTHMINCMGSKTQDGAPWQFWQRAKEAEQPNVFYHSWVYGYMSDWNARFRFFDMVSLWLRDPRNVVVFHCKSGVGRSPFTLFMIIVLTLEMKKSDAMDSLRSIMI